MPTQGPGREPECDSDVCIEPNPSRPQAESAADSEREVHGKCDRRAAQPKPATVTTVDSEPAMPRQSAG